MKILMIGLGSIGQRHLRNLRKLYGNEHEILAYRVRGLQQTFSDDMQIREGVSLEEEFHISVFHDLESALSEGPQIAFITNVTSGHIPCAIKAAKAGCDLFIEKPVSDSMEGVQELQEIARKKHNIVYIGYQNRFHPCIQEAHRWMDQGRIGNLISADNEFGERLVSMHTYEDYRSTYMARKELGGGVLLNLQIHCLDYLQALFGGPPVDVYSISGKNSNLEINVEDFVSSLYHFQGKAGETIPVYSHADFLQYPPVHSLKVVGDRGRIELDLDKAEARLFTGSSLAEQTEHKNFIRNDMFLDELRLFMKCVEDRSEPECGLSQGITGLKMAMAAKHSAEEKRVVKMEEIR